MNDMIFQGDCAIRGFAPRGLKRNGNISQVLT
jgi:hypothetical protein